MKRSKIAITVVLVFVCSLTSAIAVDSPFNFLRYVSGARAAGMAGTFVAMQNDVNGVFYNPAILSTVDEKYLSATFLKHVLDINSGTIAYATGYKENGIIGAYIGYTNYGSFDRSNSNGDKTGDFGANDLALGVAYSNQIDTNFYYGAGLKYIYAGIDDAAASALGLDLGLFYRAPDGRTTLGVSLLNAGFQLSKMNGVSESLPVDLKLGASYKVKNLPLVVAISFNHLADDTEAFFDKFKNVSIGGEFTAGKYIRLRLGYDNQIRNLTDSKIETGLTGITAGLGIRTNDFNFDYGYSNYGSSANLHRFSVSLDI